MKFCRFPLIGIAAAIALFLCGCEEMPSRVQQAVAALPIPSGWWNDDGAHGPSRIVVHLTEQKAYFYKGKILVGESTVSTGKRGFSTPQGHYSVGSKDRDHYSSEFGDYVTSEGIVVVSNIDVRKDPQPRGTHFDPARMPYCIHFNGGYAVHGGFDLPLAGAHRGTCMPQGLAGRL